MPIKENLVAASLTRCLRVASALGAGRDRQKICGGASYRDSEHEKAGRRSCPAATSRRMGIGKWLETDMGYLIVTSRHAASTSRERRNIQLLDRLVEEGTAS